MTVYDIEERIYPEFEPFVLSKEVAKHTEQIVVSVVLSTPYELVVEASVTRYNGSFAQVDVPGGRAIRYDHWRNSLQISIEDHRISVLDLFALKGGFLAVRTFLQRLREQVQDRLKDSHENARFRPLLKLPLSPEMFPHYVRLHPSQYHLALFNPSDDRW